MGILGSLQFTLIVPENLLYFRFLGFDRIRRSLLLSGNPKDKITLILFPMIMKKLIIFPLDWHHSECL